MSGAGIIPFDASDAPCRQDPDAWHSDLAHAVVIPRPGLPKDPEERRTLQTAIELCHECPVVAECRAYGIAHPELYGVWGGLTTWERWGGPCPCGKRRRAPGSAVCGVCMRQQQKAAKPEKPTCSKCDAPTSGRSEMCAPCAQAARRTTSGARAQKRTEQRRLRRERQRQAELVAS